MEIQDIEGTRSLRIDTASSASSVFLIGSTGTVMEFDRCDFVASISTWFDLLPIGIARLLGAPHNEEDRLPGGEDGLLSKQER